MFARDFGGCNPACRARPGAIARRDCLAWPDRAPGPGAADRLGRVTQPAQDPPNPSPASPFVRACRRQPVPYTPVWFMRMAGRSLPEYHRVREGIPMLESCTRPELVTEITLQPLRRYDVDAAVLFSDIVVPLRAIGVDVDIKPGVGPVIGSPVRALADVDRLRPLEPSDVPYISESVKSLVGELGGKPLIGFAGGPFTLASYLVEGGPSKNHDRTKALMYGQPELWHALMDRLAAIAIAFLQVQVDAGASAVQLFDSWAGVVSPQDYRQAILPHASRIFAALSASGVPRIHFGVGTGELLGLLGEAGADVVGVDWRIPLDEAARRVGGGKALQGNLDPSVLLAGWDVVEPRARAVLAQAENLEGHVFNLGHGVLPDTDPDILARLADLVHEVTASA
jgi:uroporphyrinogen decarboxylase